MEKIKGIWIPQEIWNLKELTWTEILLLAKVESFEKQCIEGCFATNEHFANYLRVTKESASRLINKLVKENYLISKVVYKEGTKQIQKRKLSINRNFISLKISKSGEQVSAEMLCPFNTDVVQPLYTDAKDNNKYINNKINNNIYAQNFSEEKKEHKNKLSKNLSELFEKFYKNYPKKKGKHRAYRWFKTHKPDEALVAKMIEATNQQKETFDWKKQNGKYIPHPATWLNGGNWENEIRPEEIAQVSENSVARFLAIELYEKLKHKSFEESSQNKKLIDLWALDIDKYLSFNRSKEQEDRIFYAINSLESSWVKEKIHDARSLISNLDFIGR